MTPQVGQRVSVETYGAGTIVETNRYGSVAWVKFDADPHAVQGRRWSMAATRLDPEGTHVEVTADLTPAGQAPARYEVTQ